MNNWMKKIGLGFALGATALTAAAPAEAQRWGGYRHDHYRGNGAGTAVVAGIAGLAVGAALASNRDGYREVRYRDRYYDDGYYPRGYYRGYYDRPYYPPACFIERRWDPYYDRPVHVRVCR